MKFSTLLAAFCLTALAGTTATASPLGTVPTSMMSVDGNKILAQVDKLAAAFDDQSYVATMEIVKDGKLRKTLQFESKMKGLDQQLIEFKAPGDVAGMKVLMEDANTLYVYMPEFKKVRRVAAHVQSQGFLGSEFSYEDMTQVKLSPFFDAELAGKKGNETTLLLTPKEGVETTYPKLEVVIDATKGGVTKVRYFDKSGTQVREQERTAWKKIGGHNVPTKVTMKNLKTGDATTITLSNIVVNQGISPGTFSRRELLRG
jgi:outer membrane lipoprotein-sorting protein